MATTFVRRLHSLLIAGSPRHAFLLASAWTAAVALLVLPVVRRVTGLGLTFGGDGYLSLARSIVEGHGFVFEAGGPPVFHRPPLYPLLLCPFVLLPEPLLRPALSLFQAVLVGATAAVLFRIAARYFDRRCGSIAVLLLIFNPWVLWKTGLAMSPVLQMTLFALLAYQLLAVPVDPGAPEHGSGAAPAMRRGAWIGITGGALALTHGTMLLTVGALLAFCFLRSWLRVGRTAAVPIALAAAVAALVVAPWTARNYEVSGRLIPVAGNAGFAYFYGNTHWGFDGDGPKAIEYEDMYSAGAAELTLQRLGLEGRAEEHLHYFGLQRPEMDARLTRRMVADVVEQPGRFAAKVGLNSLEYVFPVAWPLVTHDDMSIGRRLLYWPQKAARSLLFLGLFALLAVGLVRSGDAERDAARLLLVMLALFAAPYLPFFAGRSDYVLGLLPLLGLLAARGLATLLPPRLFRARQELPES